MEERLVEIRDGKELLMRPIEPSDKEALAAAFEQMSPESRYRRFFAPINRLSRMDLRYLTEVDHHNHEAIIAFEPESGEPVGVARFVRSPEPALAEVAVTVVDEWHGRGVATAILQQLVERAHEEGIEAFVAIVLEENDAAIELFEGLAANDASPRRKDGNLELLIELPRDEVSGSVLGRALQAAAQGVTMNPWALLKHRVQQTAEHIVPEPADLEDMRRQADDEA
jgi:RimJ/RimL family protein N-acetyltransferase